MCGTQFELRKQDAIRITAAVSTATRMNGLQHCFFFFVDCDFGVFLKGFLCLFCTNILIPEIPMAMREGIKKYRTP
jgi:hypothetical protein